MSWNDVLFVVLSLTPIVFLITALIVTKIGDMRHASRKLAYVEAELGQAESSYRTVQSIADKQREAIERLTEELSRTQQLAEDRRKIAAMLSAVRNTDPTGEFIDEAVAAGMPEQRTALPDTEWRPLQPRSIHVEVEHGGKRYLVHEKDGEFRVAFRGEDAAGEPCWLTLTPVVHRPYPFGAAAIDPAWAEVVRLALRHALGVASPHDPASQPESVRRDPSGPADPSDAARS